MNENDFIDQLNSYAHALEKVKISGNKILHGLFSGIHKSSYLGFGADFEDNREYNYGDNLKLINWPLWGRTEKLFVKRFKEETNTDIYIILDDSLSMLYPQGSLSKFHMAKYLAALLGIVFFNQLDRVGFYPLSGDPALLTPARGEEAKYHFINKVAKMKIGSKGRFLSAMEYFTANVHRRGIIILLSDLIYPIEELNMGLNHLKFEDHLIISIKIEHSFEIDPVFSKGSYFDPENSVKKVSVSTQEKKDYLKNFEKRNKEIREIFLEKEIIYHPIDTNTDILKFLTDLQTRSAL
ncbi:DUF58 domain-containing protein [bacterium]|nr:DUF58 domain-containing protein [bacterium]